MVCGTVATRLARRRHAKRVAAGERRLAARSRSARERSPKVRPPLKRRRRVRRGPGPPLQFAWIGRLLLRRDPCRCRADVAAFCRVVRSVDARTVANVSWDTQGS
jgi:hypothetical protein